MQSPHRTCPIPLAAVTSLGVLVVVGPACQSDWSATGVFVDVSAEAGTLSGSPEQLAITWLGAERGIFRDHLVPVRAAGTLLASVYIDVPEPGPSLERRVVVRAHGGGGAMAVGWARLTIRPGHWTTVAVHLTDHLPDDRDADGIPDDLDVCPSAPDYDGCTPGGTNPDASRATAGGDAADPNAGRDLASSSAPPGAATDTSRTTGAEDAGSPGAGASDAGLQGNLGRDASSSDAATAPTAPTNLAVKLVSPIEGELTWTDNASDESEFQIDRSELGRPYLRVATVGANVTSFVDRTLSRPATHFAFRVRAVNTAGSSAPSNVAGVFSAVPTTETRLRGRVFSSPEISATSGVEKAFDTDATSYFEAKDTAGCFIGMELSDKAVLVTKLRYTPRRDMGAGMMGGKFQGSTVSESAGYGDLVVITTAPPNAQTEVALAATNRVRWLRYVGPPGSACTVAELEFLGRAP